jgi:steroid Delta-isomerase
VLRLRAVARHRPAFGDIRGVAFFFEVYDRRGMGKTVEMKETEKRTRAAVEAYVDAWAKNDRAALLNVFAEDAVWIDPVGTPPYEGHAGIGEFWDNAHAGDATLTPEVKRIVVCANEAILLFRMVVRNSTGGGMGLDVCDQMTVNEDGKIQLAKAYWDNSCVVAIEECA